MKTDNHKRLHLFAYHWFDLKGSYPVNTPLPTGYELEENKGTATQAFCLEYQSVIGSLLCIMIGTQSDIFFAVTKMAQFSANPSSKHMNAAKHILRYLNTTQSASIIYDGGSNKGLIAFMDSD